MIVADFSNTGQGKEDYPQSYRESACCGDFWLTYVFSMEFHQNLLQSEGAR